MNVNPRTRQTGVTAVEFALGAVVLILSTLIIFESSYLVYVTNLVDYSLRETVRNTKVVLQEKDGKSACDIHRSYEQTFNSLINQSNQLWSYFINPGSYTMTGVYFLDYKDFVNYNPTEDRVNKDPCYFDMKPNDENNPLGFTYSLAEITLTYELSPLTHLFTSSNTAISRTMVLNLEHEEWPDENQ